MVEESSLAKVSSNDSLAIDVLLCFLSNFRIKNAAYEQLVQQIVDQVWLAYVGKTPNKMVMCSSRPVLRTESLMPKVKHMNSV